MEGNNVILIDPLQTPKTCTVDGCERPYYGKGFCKPCHQWRWKRGLLPKENYPQTVREHIERRTMTVPESGCWLWTGGTNNLLYGHFKVEGKNYYAHRASYELHKGPIPDGYEVCHTCDVPLCVNPDHLFVGTHKDNMSDSARKGRAKQPKFRSDHTAPRSMLTEDQVRMIRADGRGNAELARATGIPSYVIQMVRVLKTYRDVT